MKILRALKKAAKKFQQKKILSADLDAEILLSHVLRKPRSYLYIWPGKTMTASQTKRYGKLVARRLKFIPVAYLTKRKEFYGLDFYVDKNVLIPRPETESLAEEALKTAKLCHQKTIKIADIGTGSGCLAVTLKKYLPGAKIYASDLSKKALAVAKKNSKKHKLKIFFKQGDLLEPFIKIKLDLIVANLPYLKPIKEYLKNYPGLKHEPLIALTAANKGLGLYARFFAQVKKYFDKKKIIVEIDPGQKTAIRKIIRNNLPKAEIEIKKDLAGKNRIVIIN